MKKIIKLISVLIGLYIFVMQAFVSCSGSNTSKELQTLVAQDSTKYVADNFDKYKSRIKDESGFDGKVVKGVINGKEQKYIEFDIDDTTKIRFEANDLEHPLPSQKEKDECIDSQIKRNASTKELEELSSKAHSIYKVFEEICNEYNEKNEK